MRPFKLHARLRHQTGFTLVEMSVSLLVLVVVLLGMLSLFDFANRLSSVQTNVSDMQQSLRIGQQDVIRTVRMAGRAPIPLGQPPAGIAAAVWDQVPADTHIGGDETPKVVEGTDILTVRGVFSTSIYQVNSARPEAFQIATDPGGVITGGKVKISNQTPTSIPQDLIPLRDAILSARDENHPPERLVLVSARNPLIWAIVQLDLTDSEVDPSDLTEVTLGFIPVPVTAEAPAYFSLPTGSLAEITSVAFVGILEEHRFYVREDFETAPNGTQDLVSQLSRARVFPGTDVPWRGRGDLHDAASDADHPSWSMDVAENILDLQVALAFDSPRGGGTMTDDDNSTGDDDRIFESADGNDDDWLFNDEQAVNPVDWANQQLYYIRLTTLARTDRRDAGYQAPELVRLENHDLTSSRFNNRTDRMFRYRPLQTLIDMRNL